MLKYLQEYRTKFDEQINLDLLHRTYDKPLLEYIMDSWRSLQIMEAIEITGYDYTEKESEININDYIYKRERGLKQKEKVDYKYIDDSRCGLLTVNIKLRVPSINPKSGKEEIHEQDITKSMLIPLQDDKGRYYLKGQSVYLILQLVEKSTYTAGNNAVILKSLMPFAIKRYIHECHDTRGNEYKLPHYTIELFHKDIDVMLIFASRGLDFAVQYALEYPYTVINFVEEEDPDDLTNLYFQISSKLFIRVNQELFEQYTYVQSVVAGILAISTNRLTIDKINDPQIWLKKLGGINAQKGESLLSSAKRLLDETTGEILRVDIYHKHDVLSLTRWMCEEFNDLRMKDNMDLTNKRVRCNEILSCLMTQEFSERLNRIMSMGRKATIDNYRELFSFPGDILIQKLQSSGIQRYNDIINDMDMFSRCKYTIKGPNSLGNKNSNSISAKYRGLHHSFIGHIDLTVCGNSDPGTSGVITPFSKMDKLYFDASPEPDDFMFDFKKSVTNILKDKDVHHIEIKFSDKEDYYKAMNMMRDFKDEAISVFSTSKDDDTMIIVEDAIDLDEKKNGKSTTNQ